MVVVAVGSLTVPARRASRLAAPLTGVGSSDPRGRPVNASIEDVSWPMSDDVALMAPATRRSLVTATVPLASAPGTVTRTSCASIRPPLPFATTRPPSGITERDVAAAVGLSVASAVPFACRYSRPGHSACNLPFTRVAATKGSRSARMIDPASTLLMSACTRDRSARSVAMFPVPLMLPQGPRTCREEMLACRVARS